jgi:hypothetical protein
MYLLVFRDLTVRQVHDNLTVADLLAVRERLARIFTINEKDFLEIVLDDGKMCIVPIKEAKPLSCSAGKVHQ